MDQLSERAPLSISLAKVWFALLSFYISYLAMRFGFGWHVVAVLIPAVALLALVNRYRWGWFYVLSLLLVQLALIAPAGLWLAGMSTKILYQLTVLSERHMSTLPPYLVLLKIGDILLDVLTIALLVWLVVDFFRNARVKAYFISNI